MTAGTRSPEDDATQTGPLAAKATSAGGSKEPGDAGGEPQVPLIGHERPHATPEDIRKLLDLFLGDD